MDIMQRPFRALRAAEAEKARGEKTEVRKIEEEKTQKEKVKPANCKIQNSGQLKNYSHIFALFLTF